MKMAIASNGRDLDSNVDERFGRADYFLITDSDNTKIEEVIDNKSKNDNTGAGIAAAKLVLDKGAKTVVAGNLGPKAEQVLMAAGAKFISFAGKVSKALNLNSDIAATPLDESETKINQTADNPVRNRERTRNPESGCINQGRGSGQGFGGGGGGGGRGRGMGKGGGCGGGRGMGKGGGRGAGRNNGSRQQGFRRQ